MITARRSQEFHELVEGTTSGGARSTVYAPLLETVGALRAVPAPVADPAFVAALRERLMAEAETVLVAAAANAEVDQRLRLHTAPPRVRRRNRRLAVAVSGLALAGATATMSVAAQSALPGDGLYPLKRGIESAHAQLTFDQAGQGRVVLASASTRLDEVSALSREGADPARISDTLDAFTHEAISGSDLLVQDYQATGHESSITAVRTFTSESMTRLHSLQSSIPGGSDAQLLQAAETLDQIQEVSVHSCSGCAGPLVTQVPTVLHQAQQQSTQLLESLSQTGTPGPSHAHGTRFTPVLPHVDGHLPPASVTDPGTTDTGATKNTVSSTIDGLTGGLTNGTQDTSTVGNVTDNLLDSVSQTGTDLDGTIGGLTSQATGLLPTNLPTDLPTNLPTSLPTNLPSGVPTSVPTTLPSALPSLP